MKYIKILLKTMSVISIKFDINKPKLHLSSVKHRSKNNSEIIIKKPYDTIYTSAHNYFRVLSNTELPEPKNEFKQLKRPDIVPIIKIKPIITKNLKEKYTNKYLDNKKSKLI